MTAELAETTAPDSWGPRSSGLRQAGRYRGRSARRTLARSWRDDQVFGAGIPQRMVIVEFESFEKVLAAVYKSDTYQNALAVLAYGAVRDTRIVEGVD